MGLGSKSRVRVPLPGFGYQKSRGFLGFWGILASRLHHYWWVPVAKVGFGSGLGRVWVGFGFGYQKVEVFLQVLGFRVPKPITITPVSVKGWRPILTNYEDDARILHLFG